MLHKFTSKRGAKTISAQMLDDNFAQLQPLQPSGNAKHYSLSQSPQGWSMRIFPEAPLDGKLYVLALSNGQMVWYPTKDCVS